MSAVYWITGLSGAGKTTIGKLFYEELKTEHPNTVFLDGDMLRKVFGDDLGYTRLPGKNGSNARCGTPGCVPCCRSRGCMWSAVRFLCLTV